MPTNERDALIAALKIELNDDTAAAHIYPSTLKTFQRGEHGGECWSIKVGNEDEESVGVFTIEQVFNALAATAPNAGAPLVEALEEYLEAQDSLDNRELHGINAEPWEVLMRRRNAARRDLDAAMTAPTQPVTQEQHDAAMVLIREAFEEDDAAAPAQQAGAPLPLAPSEEMVKVALSANDFDIRTAFDAAIVHRYLNGYPLDIDHLSHILRVLHAAPQATLPASEAVAYPPNINGTHPFDERLAAARAAIAEDRANPQPIEHLYEGTNLWAERQKLQHYDDPLDLTATRAQPQADAAEPVAGIELAARFVEKRLLDYDAEHGMTDPATGTREYPGDGDEYVGELQEIADGIRAIAAQAPGARGDGDAQ